MRDFFQSVKFKIIIALTALLIGAMIYSVTTGGYSTTSSYIFEMIFEPVKKLSHNISDQISVKLDMLINAEKYYNENQQLKKQLDELYNQIIDYDEIVHENGDLRTMLDLKEGYDNYKFSPPCTVIARATNDPYASFTVDKGSDDGIKPGDPVVTQNGIVGVCSEVSPVTCKIRTLFSPKTSMGAYAVRTKAEGVVSGGYEYASDGKIRMEHIAKESDIEKGDIIVTSGSANFPAGHLIGVVDSVEMETNGLSKYAIIIPAEDPRTLSGVFVVTDYKLDEITAIKTGQDQNAEDGETD